MLAASLSLSPALTSAAPAPAGADAKIEPAATGTIEGVVTGEDTGPLGGTSVALMDATTHTQMDATSTDGEGRYTFTGVEEGTYHLSFDHPSFEYHSEYWSGKQTLDVADVLTVTVGGVTTASTELQLLPRIEGYAYDLGTRAPLSNMKVVAFDAMAAWAGAPEPRAVTFTEADGSYSLRGLSEETAYIITFSDPTGVYRDIAWPGFGVPVEQTPLAIMAEDPQDEIDGYMIRTEVLKATRVQRIAGDNRYETALEISRSTFYAAETAIIVSGEQFPDALSAAPLAGVHSAPILLTPAKSLPAGLTAELRRLGVKNLVIVGGTAAVSGNVQTQLASAGFGSIRRIQGMNRYETAAAVAREVMNVTGRVLEPFICRGDAFPDALSAAPFAYMQGRPILLVQSQLVPAATGRIWASMYGKCENTLIVVGGTAAISNSVLDQLIDYTPEDELYYARPAGASRYDTCTAVIRLFGSDFDTYGIASGANYPDALTGAAACGYMFGPVLLTTPSSLVAPARVLLAEDGQYVMAAPCFGGTSALSSTVVNQVRSALGSTIYDIDDSLLPLSVTDGAYDGIKGSIVQEARLAGPGPKVRFDVRALHLLEHRRER